MQRMAIAGLRLIACAVVLTTLAGASPAARTPDMAPAGCAHADRDGWRAPGLLAAAPLGRAVSLLLRNGWRVWAA